MVKIFDKFQALCSPRSRFLQSLCQSNRRKEDNLIVCCQEQAAHRAR